MENNQSDNQSKQTASDFQAMPPVEALKGLPLEVQKQLLVKFSAANAPAEPEPEAKDETPAAEPKEESEPSAEDNQKEPEPEHDAAWHKNQYKELQKLVAKKDQDIKDLKEARKSEIPGSKTDEIIRKRFDKLVEENKEAKGFLGNLRDAIKEEVEDMIRPIHDKITNQEASENETGFRNSLHEFLQSDLKELEPHLDQLMAEKFGDEAGILKAAQKDPSLFDKLKGELFVKHFNKVKDIVSKPKESSREEEIKKAGVSGKGKTSAPLATDNSNPENFTKLSLEDQKKELQKMGLVSKSALFNKKW